MESFIRDHLSKLADIHGGLTPEIVVADAKDPASPIHEEFEWDMEKAAEQHWLDQARTLIRRIHIVSHKREATVHVPQYVRDPDLPAETAGYVKIMSMQTDRERSMRLLNQELSRVTSMLQRAREIALVLELSDEIDQYIHSLMPITEKVRSQVAA
jgi:hypothetical protein